MRVHLLRYYELIYHVQRVPHTSRCNFNNGANMKQIFLSFSENVEGSPSVYRNFLIFSVTYLRYGKLKLKFYRDKVYI